MWRIYAKGNRNMPVEPLKDDDPMPIGKYKGTKMGNVPATWLDWFRDQPWARSYPKILAYINKNKEHIDRELDDE